MWRIALLIAAFMLAPALAPYDPLQTNPAKAFNPPSAEHAFGTDQLGRDVLSRTLHGGRTTLSLTVSSTVISLVLGTGGAVVVSGIRVISHALFRIVIISNNTLRSIPTIVIAITIVTLLDNTTSSLLISTVVAQTPTILQWLHERISEIDKEPHIEGAKAIGATNFHIAIRHTLPFLTSELKNQTILTLQTTLITIGGLTFLGFGLSTQTPEWGALLKEGRDAFRVAPWISIAPGLCITALCASSLHITNKTQSLKTTQPTYRD